MMTNEGLYQALDWDALYIDLGWEPREVSGPEDKGYCLDPWQMHKNGDTTGKLAINRDKGVYNCWVCGGGTIVSLVMEVKQISYREAVRYLSRFVNAFHKESEADFRERVEHLLADTKQEKKPTPIFNATVLDQWQGWHPWFESRHIDRVVVEYFRAGVSREHRRFSPKHGEYVGTAVILPHFYQGLLVGWQERWLDDTPPWIGKYTNTTGFPRETTVWGHDFACGQDKPPVVVESVPTALRLISDGFPAVATFGAQVTPHQLRLLRVFQGGLWIARDNDAPGAAWRDKLVNGLHRYVPLCDVPVVEGDGADLGDADDISPYLRDVKVALPTT